MATNCLEKPHCGELGEPFINNIIGAALVNLSNLSFNASSDSSTGALEFSSFLDSLFA